jgi:RNA polymerase sigma-70 factor (ECF subfamily)
MGISDLYTLFQNSLHRAAQRLTRDPDEADDLVQDTFVRALGHLALLELLNETQCRDWLYQTLRNLFLDRTRARQRREDFQNQWMRYVEQTNSAVVEANASSIFDQIPERYREVIHKRYTLGMTSQEIGKELDIPAATVRSWLYQAIRTARKRRKQFL